MIQVGDKVLLIRKWGEGEEPATVERVNERDGIVWIGGKRFSLATKKQFGNKDKSFRLA